MLTDRLEKAIGEGIAVFKTFAVGTSGVGTIPVSKNRFIIIIDFDYSYFSDAVDTTPPPVGPSVAVATPPDFTLRNTYQLEFRSKTSQNHFIIRNEYQNITLAGEDIAVPIGNYKKDIFLVHKENVQIDIINVPSTDNWVGNTYSTLPTKSEEQVTPVGYGQLAAGQPAVRKTSFSATEIYLPLTKQRDDLAAPIGYREQFRVDVNSANKLNAPLLNEFGDYSYPILNVNYVEFSVPWNEFVKSSN